MTTHRPSPAPEFDRFPRRRLRSMGLNRSWSGSPQDVVRRLVAVQAQDFAGAKWAVGMRLSGSTDASVEHAFAEGSILRTHLLRPTWHFVAPEDIRWLLALTGPRVHAANNHMYLNLGLDAADFRRGQVAIARALEDGECLTRGELAAAMRGAGVRVDSGQRLAYLVMHAELDGLICSGPRRGKQFTYALLDARAPSVDPCDRPEALTRLSRGFFETRGPATVQDFAKWSGLTVSDARRGLEGAQPRLRHEVVDGQTYWFASGRTPATKAAPFAHLLSIYDEYISGYRDRRAIGGDKDRDRLVGMGAALTGVILLDGRIAGTWKRTLLRDRVRVDPTLFRSMTRAEKNALTDSAERYGRFLNRPASLS